VTEALFGFLGVLVSAVLQY